MDLIKITDLSAQLGLSSRTLRYYEEAGLIKSIRPQFEAYRFFDETAVERLHQIMVLRKMQIPIKDIVRIYENPEIATLVDVFVGKINAIDGEVTALSELKSIINTFPKKMIESGIKKISALPLLYEEMDKQLELMEEQMPVSYEALESVSEKLSKPIEPAIIPLFMIIVPPELLIPPPMPAPRLPPCAVTVPPLIITVPQDPSRPLPMPAANAPPVAVIVPPLIMTVPL